MPPINSVADFPGFSNAMWRDNAIARASGYARASRANNAGNRTERERTRAVVWTIKAASYNGSERSPLVISIKPVVCVRVCVCVCVCVCCQYTQESNTFYYSRLVRCVIIWSNYRTNDSWKLDDRDPWTDPRIPDWMAIITIIFTFARTGHTSGEAFHTAVSSVVGLINWQFTGYQMKREREKERERQTAVGISCAQNGPRDGERTPRRTSPLGCCPILAPTQFIHNRLFQRIILRSTTNLWVLPSGRRVIMRVRCVARRRDAEGQKLWVSFIVRTVSCSPRVRVHVFPFELATTRFSFSSFFLSFFLLLFFSVLLFSQRIPLVAR